MDVAWFALLVVAIGAFALLVGAGRSREDVRMRRRWDAAFERESRRTSHTDATGAPLPLVRRERVRACRPVPVVRRDPVSRPSLNGSGPGGVR